MSNDPAERAVWRLQRAVLMYATSIRATATTTEYVHTVRDIAAEITEVATDLNAAADRAQQPPEEPEQPPPPTDNSGTNPGRCVHPERTGRAPHEQQHTTDAEPTNRRHGRGGHSGRQLR